MGDVRFALGLIGLAFCPASGWAQTVPTIDTEDASLGSAAAGGGRFHPAVGIDLRNGDFARGGYDDDAANLDRLPVHVQIGFAWNLHKAGDSNADLWLVGMSSNGIHAPSAMERTSPRGLYESNNLIGLVAKFGVLSLAAAYTIKASPNGVSGTTHEASVAAELGGDTGIASLHPGVAVTTRTEGDGGFFTQFGIRPEIALTGQENGVTIGFPAAIGIGWHGFYGQGTSDVVYGSTGVSFSQPLVVGAIPASFHAEVLALVRDDRLRRLGGPKAGTATLVPQATIGLSFAF